MVSLTYELMFTTGLRQPFQAIEEIAGTGAAIERTLKITEGQSGFYTVRTKAPQ